MKRNQQARTLPRLLPHVLQAIADLKESGGTTSRKIIDLVQTNVSKAPRQRNITMLVRKALKHGVETGLIKQRQGRYYANLKGFDPLKDCAKCRRKGKKGGGGGKRRKRKRSGHSDSSATSVDSVSASDSDWEDTRSNTREPNDRRGKRRGGEGKKKRGRKHSAHGHHKPMNASNKDDRCFDADGKDYSKEFNHLNDQESRPECDNPDCLCNLKQEPVDAPRTSKDEFQDYLN